MVVTLDQQYNVGEKRHTVLYTYINHDAQHNPTSGHKKHLGRIKGYKYITFSWYLNGYPDGDNLGSII